MSTYQTFSAVTWPGLHVCMYVSLPKGSPWERAPDRPFLSSCALGLSCSAPRAVRDAKRRLAFLPVGPEVTIVDNDRVSKICDALSQPGRRVRRTSKLAVKTNTPPLIAACLSSSCQSRERGLINCSICPISNQFSGVLLYTRICVML